MKQVIRFSSVAILLIAFSVNVSGQVSANTTASATATIITPISITKVTDMAFGTLTVGAVGGTIILGTDNSRTPSADINLMAAPLGQAASFSITAGNLLTYTITIPNTTLISGANNMTLDTFTTTLASPATGTGAAQALVVGGTLHVGASQPTGLYTGTVSVTVAYN